MTNITLGYGILISLGVALLAGLFPLEPATTNGFYSLSGLGMLFFGVWGAIRLIK